MLRRADEALLSGQATLQRSGPGRSSRQLKGEETRGQRGHAGQTRSPGWPGGGAGGEERQFHWVSLQRRNRFEMSLLDKIAMK